MIERNDEIRMLFSELAQIPVAKHEWKDDESSVVAGFLHFLEVDQRKGEAVAVHQEN